MATAARAVTRIGWHELVAPDVARAEVFYAQLFGWTLRVWRPGVHDYAMIHSGGADHGGFLEQDVEPHWLVYVEVPDADAVAARMLERGGRLAAGPVELPGVGRYVVLADPWGARIAAIAVHEQGEAPAGVFGPDELLAPDPAAAAELYGELFAWRDGACAFGRDDRARWIVHLRTDDVEATTARAVRLGAVVTDPGRRLLTDPAGAEFGLSGPI